MDLTTTLANATGADATARAAALQSLQMWEESYYPDFLAALAVDLGTEGKDPNGRRLAGLHLKNMVYSDSRAARSAKEQRWSELAPEVKNGVRAHMWAALVSAEKEARRSAAQAIAAYAAVDLLQSAPEGESLAQHVVSAVTDAATAGPVRETALECVGYLCERLKGETDAVPRALTDAALTAIVFALGASQPASTRHAAIKALLNTLEFAHGNFDTPAERESIMGVLTAEAVSEDAEMRAVALECLVQVADLYYAHVGDYLASLATITTNALRGADERSALQAAEFWITLCKAEADFAEDYRTDDGLFDEAAARAEGYKGYMRPCAASLVPFLLEALTKQDEADEEGEGWSLAMAGGQCLEELALAIGNDIVPLVMPMCVQYITAPEWRTKDAALSAFSCALEGPDVTVLQPYVTSAVPVLVASLSDAHVMVRTTAAWCVGKIFELHSHSIAPTDIDNLVGALNARLDDRPMVAEKACVCFARMAQQCAPFESHSTNLLSGYIPTIVPRLFEAAARDDSDECNLAVAAYDAASMMVSNAALDMQEWIMSTLSETCARVSRTLEEGADLAALDAETRDNLLDKQAQLCALVHVVVRKAEDARLLPAAPYVLDLLLRVLKVPNSAAHSDVINGVAFIADKLKEHFLPYARVFVPLLHAYLTPTADPIMSAVAVINLGAIFRNLGKLSIEFSDTSVDLLLALLRSQDVDNSVKPKVISAFADLALELSGAVERYVPAVAQALTEAAAAAKDIPADYRDDEDIVAYMNELRVSIMEAFSGMMQGLSDDGKQAQLAPYLQALVVFLDGVAAEADDLDADLLHPLLGILQDVLTLYGPEAAQVMAVPNLARAVQDALTDEDEDLRNDALKVQRAYRRLTETA